MSARIDTPRPDFGVRPEQLMRPIPAPIMRAAEQAAERIVGLLDEKRAHVEHVAATGDSVARHHARRALGNLGVLSGRINEATELFCQGRTGRARNILSSLNSLAYRALGMPRLLDELWEVVNELERGERER